jgi:hypothetical protein
LMVAGLLLMRFQKILSIVKHRLGILQKLK